MRKWILIFCAMIVLFVSACTPQSESEQTLQLYYKAAEVTFSDEGLICGEEIHASAELPPSALAERYFAGPDSETLVSPFPKGTALHAYTLNGTRLHLTLSEEFAQLGNADLSLALSCIASTFTQLQGVEAVVVDVVGEALNEQAAAPITMEKLLLSDNTQDLVEATVSVFYADKESRYLIEEKVKTKLETVEEQAAYAVSLLGQLPDTEALRTTLPKGTEILDLSIEDHVCSIDFSEEFYLNRPQTDGEERIVLLSIVNTLTSFDEIETVQFFVSGESLDVYHKMKLNLQFSRDESAIGPVRIGMNEIDASIYIQRDSDKMLIALPVRLRPAANEAAEDAVLQTLIQYEKKNGLSSAIPSATKILSVDVRDEYCYVDLSQSFANGLMSKESELNAVRAIVSSLKSLDHISFVVLSVEGKSDVLKYVNLNQVF